MALLTDALSSYAVRTLIITAIHYPEIFDAWERHSLCPNIALLVCGATNILPAVFLYWTP